jgi:ComEC/Rec2-related protein
MLFDMRNNIVFLLILLIIVLTSYFNNNHSYQRIYYQNLNQVKFKVIKKINNNYILQKDYLNKKNSKNYLLYCKKCKFNRGDIILLTGKIMPFNKKLTPIAKNYQIYLQKYQLQGKIISKSYQIVKKSNNYLDFLRKKFINLIKNNTSHPLAITLLTGNKSKIPTELYDKFKITGVAHILAISALHIAGIALMFFYFSRMLCALSSYLSSRYNNKKIALFFSYLAALSFLFIANFPISGQRALFFLSVIYLGILYNLKISLINLILISLVFFLIIDPYLLFTAAFQMSFASVIIIARLVNNKKSSQKRNFIRTIYHYEKDIFIISVFISIILLPITIFHFNSSSFIAPFTNLIVIPLVTLVIMPFAMLTLISSIFNIEKYFFISLDFLLDRLIDVVDLFYKYAISLPYQIKLNNYSLLLVALCLILCLISNSKKLDLIAAIFYISAFLVPYLEKKPDLIITPKNKIYLAKLDYLPQQYVINDKKISDWDYQDLEKYYGKLQKINSKKTINLSGNNNNLKCLNNICLYKKNNKLVTIIMRKTSYIEFQTLCHKTNIMINLTSYYQSCYDKFNINSYNLRKYGTMNIFLNKKIEIINLN